MSKGEIRTYVACSASDNNGILHGTGVDADQDADGLWGETAAMLSPPSFRGVKARTSAELTQLTHIIAPRVGHFLERQGVFERDAENSYLSGDAVEGGPLDQLLGHSMTYTRVPMPLVVPFAVYRRVGYYLAA